MTDGSDECRAREIAERHIFHEAWCNITAATTPTCNCGREREVEAATKDILDFARSTPTYQRGAEAMREATPWRPIETYPRDAEGWGPEVVVILPPSKAQVFVCGVAQPEISVPAVTYVAHLEAEMWLSRDCGDPVAWGELPAKPTHWMPLPALPTATPEAETMP